MSIKYFEIGLFRSWPQVIILGQYITFEISNLDGF